MNVAYVGSTSLFIPLATSVIRRRNQICPASWCRSALQAIFNAIGGNYLNIKTISLSAASVPSDVTLK